MKLIKLTCACGASAEFHGDGQLVVDGYKTGDAHGDRFVIQSASRQWQERHIDCAKMYSHLSPDLLERISNDQGETK